MKNKKLNLNELKIKSFVTDLDNGKENTVKGGADQRTTPNVCVVVGSVRICPFTVGACIPLTLNGDAC